MVRRIITASRLLFIIMSNRKKLIAGNWKMNKTSADGISLVTELVATIGKQSDVEVVVCPPFTALESAAKALDGSTLKLGAQNMHFEASGAFTGEISAAMLRALFATHVSWVIANVARFSARRMHS